MPVNLASIRQHLIEESVEEVSVTKWRREYDNDPYFVEE